MSSAPVEALPLAQDLVRCPSVTPADAGALDVLQAALERIGFVCRRLPFGDGADRVDNLYARKGNAGPNFCFAGHTDVVPPGDRHGWSVEPFGAVVKDGKLYGRGAADMKGAIAAFVAAAAASDAPANGKGSISLLITGDEEGVAVNGTKPVLDWLAANGETLDHCVVGEPSNPKALGDMIKIGRRGSLNTRLVVKGMQGHVAYPALADNPVPRLLAALNRLTETPLDRGTAHFQPSNLEITSIDVGNAATNVIPARAEARFNIRFNDAHSSESLKAWIAERVSVAGAHELAFQVSGESFVTPPGPFIELVAETIASVTGRRPDYSTSGGTSDARFIRAACPVVEFGLINLSMHKVDEHVALADLRQLTEIYARLLARYFAAPPPRETTSGRAP